MKKLLLTSALAGSLLVSVSASAEMKIKGYVETTMGSGETPATSAVTNQGTSIGYETGVTFSGTKELDNGMSMSTKATLEDTKFKNQSMSFTADGTTVFIGQDYHGLDDKQTVPAVANMIEDGNKGLGVSYNNNKLSIHGNNGVGIMNKSDMGTVAVYYTPKSSSDSANDSNPNAIGKLGSGTAIGFQGGLGIEGLSTNLFRTKATKAADSAEEMTMTGYGVKYTMGSISAGIQQTKVDDANLSATFTAGSEAEYTSYGATFAATDALSLGVQYAETSLTGSTSDEEVLSLTVGYNLGGQVVSVQYHDVENADTTKGSDGSAIELRIKSSF
jgi:hypothetical protein